MQFFSFHSVIFYLICCFCYFTCLVCFEFGLFWTLLLPGSLHEAADELGLPLALFRVVVMGRSTVVMLCLASHSVPGSATFVNQAGTLRHVVLENESNTSSSLSSVEHFDSLTILKQILFHFRPTQLKDY